MSGRDLNFTAVEEVWPLNKPFRISRGTRTEARVIVVTVMDGQHTGRGEAVPSRRYGENSTTVIALLNEVMARSGRSAQTPFQCREQINRVLSAGAARNALDCALWDLEAKTAGKRAWTLAEIEVADAVETAFTLSLGTPESMAAAAKDHRSAPTLKLKLGGDELDLARVEAVKQMAPNSRLLIDANESWSAAHYQKVVPGLCRLDVDLIEQPFPADADQVLESLDHPIPVCADESCHTTVDLPRLVNRYEAVNVKLDKTGGLTEALRLTTQARRMGFRLLFGCMVCTSLGIAPARLLPRNDDYVDLDGPLLLGKDREHGLAYCQGKIGLPSRQLWG